MDMLSFFCIVAGIHFILWFLDFLLKTLYHCPYQSLLKRSGLTIKFLNFEWYTTAFNRHIHSFSTNWAKTLRLSFDLGVWVTIVLVPISLAILAHTVFTQLLTTAPDSPTSRNVEIEILVPGVTLPGDELGFYISTLLLCTVLHEVGHALASCLENVALNGFGLRLFFVIPMAYTDISTDGLDRVTPWKKLRIFCAGAWHNIIMGVLSYLLLSSLPTLLSPFYNTTGGAYILSVAEESAIGGPRGLRAHDVILKINGSPIKDSKSYYEALVRTLREKPKFCVTPDFVHVNDESRKVETVNGVVECCDPEYPENICFEHFIQNGILEMPPLMCLHVRRLIESSGAVCDEQDNCNPGYYCIQPLLDNQTTIIHIERASGKDVIYLGHPGDIYRTTKWSPYVPKTFLGPRVVEVLLLLVKYWAVFSFGLAFVNILPCYGFDGQHIMKILVHWLGAKFGVKRVSREFIFRAAVIFGTILLFITVGHFLKQTFAENYRHIQNAIKA